MNPITHIRKNVLRLTQKGLAEVAGTNQTAVSRWERGEKEPHRDQMSLIRSKALELGKEWDDSWFFVNPPQDKDVAA